MNIVLIGSGNVAWNLGKLFVSKGHTIVQIISRNATTASDLAYELDTESANYFSIIHKDADLYIIAVADDAIESITNELIGLNKLIVHTSGAISMDVLSKCSHQFGTLYPLQSLVYGAKQVPEISFLIQGNNEEITHQLKQFVERLQMPVSKMSSTDKEKLHVAAVLVNNFTHHLFVIAQQWCKQNGIDFKLLLPLIKETTDRVVESITTDEQFNLKKLQTGPAIRGDKATIAKHLELLKNDNMMSELYQLMTDYIRH